MNDGGRISVSPLLISMLGIVVTTTAIMVYHLILVKYCIRRYATNAPPPQPTAEPEPPTGVDEKVLVAIPILAFSLVKRGIDQGECVVCLGELEDEDAVRLLPNCNHAFHVSCIDQWFAAHTSCPLCRLPVHLEQPIAEPAPPDPHAAEDPNGGGSSDNQATNVSVPPPLPMEQPIRMLSHCVSLVTPLPAAMERGSWTRLKRSLSMDESAVVIDLHRANCSNTTSLSSPSRGILIRSGSFSTRPLSQFERVPSNWRVSFTTWLRVGKAPNGSILPY